jgi:hypothetical protein
MSTFAEVREWLDRLFKGKGTPRTEEPDQLVFPSPQGTYAPVSAFLRGSWVPVVIHQRPGGMSYDAQAKRLYVQYPDGVMYAYDDVDEREATSLFDADHKGSWIWDHFRIRGTLHGQQKRYAIVHDPGSTTKWAQTDQGRKEHKEAVGGDAWSAFPGFSSLRVRRQR